MPQIPPDVSNAFPGIDPNELQAVKKEQIKVLPFLFQNDDN